MTAAIILAARAAERLDREAALRSGGYSEAHIVRTLAAYDAQVAWIVETRIRRSPLANTAAASF